MSEYLDKSIPRDPNARPSAVVFAMDPLTKEYFPLTATDNGDGSWKLSVDATFSGSISIGNVSIKDAVGSQLAKVTADGEIYVRDNVINMTADYVYRTSTPGLGKISTIKEYKTGAALGAPAKLTTYTYNVDDKVEKIVETDTTV